MNKYIKKDRRTLKERRDFSNRMRLMQQYFTLSHLSKEEISKELNLPVDIVQRIAIDADENN